MTRRGVLSALLGSASAMTLDPERLLWVPNKKLISIPKANLLPEGIWGWLKEWDTSSPSDAAYYMCCHFPGQNPSNRVVCKSAVMGGSVPYDMQLLQQHRNCIADFLGVRRPRIPAADSFNPDTWFSPALADHVSNVE